VFCVYTETDRANANVLDLSKWVFLVISTAKINRIFKDQKTVMLDVIWKYCEKTDVDGLATAIDAALAEGEAEAAH
jgi:hypothetical protein